MEYVDTVPSMNQFSKPRRSSGKQQYMETSVNILLPTSQCTELEGKLKPEKPSCSYADLHHGITKTVRGPQKQQIDGKEIDEDELVKYMSNLPSYLQRGQTLQEKALNVGVLDWRLLERWQYSHKQMPYRNSRYSPSSSNTSSSFSTDESSTHSSRGHSCSPARQRTNRPSLQVHLRESPMEGPSEVVKSCGAGVGKFQTIEPTQSGIMNTCKKFIAPAPAPALCIKHPDVKLEQCKKDELDLKRERDPVSGNLHSDQSSEMASSAAKTQGVVDCSNREKIQKPNSKNFEHTSPEGCKTIVLLLPRSLQESNHPRESPNSNLGGLSGQKSQGCKKACHAELISDIPHSCPLPSGVGSEEAQVERLSSLDSGAVGINCLSDSVSSSPEVGLNPSRGSNLEAQKSIVVPACPTSVENSKVSDKNSNKVRPEKVKSTSPFYRFTIGTGRMSKSSSLKDNVDVDNQGSTNVSAKSGTANSVCSASNDSTGGKLNSTSRKSSPLRRLLDPLLKPKAENCHHSVEPLKRASVQTDRPCKSVDGRHVSLALRPGKVKLDMIGCKTINVNELAQDKKHGSTAQALLRVTHKNGLPLFTFGVDKESNILAATVKKLNSTKKDGCSFIYTFFTIQDMKKKSGSWIGQGSKGKGHDYTSNVVAQMKVSDSKFFNLNTQKFSVREFVLFSVDLRQADDQTSDFKPNDELAAIVVKIPKKTNSSSVKDGPENASQVNSEECLLEQKCYSNSLDGVQSQSFFGCQDFVSTTVILPSAKHSLPSKGGPSSLIERWNSGGACDCGGWDIGCKLRILANQNQVHKKLSVSKGCPITERLELFPKGGQENQLFLSLAPFKEGIYSVEFNSSLSILQAFSICTAALDSKKLCEEKTYGEPMLVENAGTSAPNRIEGEVPRYISYPPLSPVGRV